MPDSNDFVDYVIEQLQPFARVISKRMFGGYGLYADELFFGLVGYDELYFKVDDSNRQDYIQKNCKPFAPHRNDPTVTLGYYNVPADVLDDSDELARWARKSFEVALIAARAKAAKKTNRKKSAKKTVTKKEVAKKKR
jgi:DNA transformation protein and related proteins